MTSPNMWASRNRSDLVEGDFPAVKPFPELTSPNSLKQALTALTLRPAIFVLALTRTGSKSALGYFHAAFRQTHRLMHAHGVSNRFRHSTLSPQGQKRIERTERILRSGCRTTVVVPIRNSVDRIYSFFLYAHREHIADYFDQETQEFRERDTIRKDFSEFCLLQAAWENLWYKDELLDPFGFDFRSIPSTMGGDYVTEVRGRTFIVLRCEDMTATISNTASRIAGGKLPAFAAVNTAADHGISSAASAFRRQFEFPEAAMDVLRRNPYSQHLYPLPKASSRLQNLVERVWG